MRWIIVLLVLVGCSPKEDSPIVKHEMAFITSRIVDNLPEWCSGAFACWKETSPGISEIWVLADYYPECLLHEVRHAHEGNWHKGRHSIESCRVDNELNPNP